MAIKIMKDDPSMEEASNRVMELLGFIEHVYLSNEEMKKASIEGNKMIDPLIKRLGEDNLAAIAEWDGKSELVLKSNI